MTRRAQFNIEMLEPRRLLAGVTLITHGFGGSAGDWVTTMGNVIASQSGALAAQPRYLMTVTDPGHDGGPLSVTSSALGPAYGSWGSSEIIVLLDWSDVAGSFPFGGYHRTTTDVGAAVAAKFLNANSIPGLSTPLAQLPMHLVGHSRGAGLISEMSRGLGEKGAWVDQLTYLDPHPVDGIRDPLGIDFDDSPMRVYENVQYAEDYWRTQTETSFDFTGEAVNGAYNLQLSESVLTSGGYSVEHSDTHLWYHGTIGPVGGPFENSDGPPGGASIGSAWYSSPHPSRDSSGFRYSRLGKGARPAAGLKSSGAFRDAVTLTASGANVWDNVSIGGLSNDVSITSGTALNLNVSFDDRGTDDGTITIGFDRDDDPFNGFVSASSLPTPSSGGTIAVPVPTSDVSGAFRVVARISNGLNMRYYYAPGRAIIAANGFDKTWIGATSGAWNVGSNWTGGTTPAGDHTVAIFDSDVTTAQTLTIAGLALTGGATLDLADNDLVINYDGASPLGSWNGSAYTSLTGLIQNGELFTSLTSVNNTTRALGVGEASALLGLAGGDTANWNGATVDATTVLIKYTYKGDIDLNGEINGDDYFYLDSNVVNSTIVFGYSSGDVNLDGQINGDDYFWLDSQILSQGHAL